MSTERYYNEDEIAAIFKQAAAAQESAQQKLPSGGELMTLAEIEQIGREVGITPEFIARAAASIDRKILAPAPTTFLGLDVSVGRTVDLPGPFSDEDWDRLVSDLNETFGVPGEVRRNGSLRQWHNETVQVVVEPLETGHRLRFHGQNDDLKSGLIVSLVFFLMGLFFMLILVAKGEFAVDLAKTIIMSMFPVVGAGGYGFSAYLLSRWREKYKRNIEAIATRAIDRVGIEPSITTGEKDRVGHIDLDDQAEDLIETAHHRMRPKTRT